MEQDERDLREREFAQRNEQHRQTVRQHWWTAGISIVTLVLSAVAIASTIVYAQRQDSRAATEFEASARDDHYNQIIGGLGSSAAAVQSNSMRLLTDFVQDDSNYRSEDDRDAGIANAIQILTAFMEDNSTVAGRPGLAEYQSPLPIVLARAMSRLRVLLEDDDLGAYVADISRSNLHGVSLTGFEPNGKLIAVATDFRRASLGGLDLSARPADLTAGFFTCATLAGAELGEADVRNADFTGADLSGADLSDVQNLEPDQLHGVVVDQDTRLPGRVQPPGPVWGDRTAHCFHLVNDMTGIRGAQGYSDLIPCPRTVEAARRTELDPPFVGDVSDLAEACRLRLSAD